MNWKGTNLTSFHYYIISSVCRYKGDVVTSPESIIVITPTKVLVNILTIQHCKWCYTYRSVPAQHIYEKVTDKSSATDYEIQVLATDIPVTSCPAYVTTTFTETEKWR